MYGPGKFAKTITQYESFQAFFTDSIMFKIVFIISFGIRFLKKMFVPIKSSNIHYEYARNEKNLSFSSFSSFNC
jgi:hypothetical protein